MILLMCITITIRYLPLELWLNLRNPGFGRVGFLAEVAAITRAGLRLCSRATGRLQHLEEGPGLDDALAVARGAPGGVPGGLPELFRGTELRRCLVVVVLLASPTRPPEELRKRKTQGGCTGNRTRDSLDKPEYGHFVRPQSPRRRRQLAHQLPRAAQGVLHQHLSKQVPHVAPLGPPARLFPAILRSKHPRVQRPGSRSAATRGCARLTWLTSATSPT